LGIRPLPLLPASGSALTGIVPAVRGRRFHTGLLYFILNAKNTEHEIYTGNAAYPQNTAHALHGRNTEHPSNMFQTENAETALMTESTQRTQITLYTEQAYKKELV
jgi:hypothetical protein